MRSSAVPSLIWPISQLHPSLNSFSPNPGPGLPHRQSHVLQSCLALSAPRPPSRHPPLPSESEMPQGMLPPPPQQQPKALTFFGTCLCSFAQRCRPAGWHSNLSAESPTPGASGVAQCFPRHCHASKCIQATFVLTASVC